MLLPGALAARSMTADREPTPDQSAANAGAPVAGPGVIERPGGRRAGQSTASM
jgi:hypothetical protein